MTAWPSVSRRGFVAAAALLTMPHARGAEPVMRAVPATGERVAAIGMGSWITFDVRGAQDLAVRVDVMRAFFHAGGHVVDCSPMYGRSPDVIGHCLRELENDDRLFAASKVWVTGPERGRYQVRRSAERWGIASFDLMQIHNMVDWQRHLPVLREMQAAGQLRYVGIATSHGRRHSALRGAMSRERFDVVQFTYNIAERRAEEYLLPLARDRGAAVIVNRPFATGALFARVRGKALPGWAADIGCDAWSQVFLKFVISHPAVTCAIPATSQVAHMRENMAALSGPLPDAALRRRMAADFDQL